MSWTEYWIARRTKAICSTWIQEPPCSARTVLTFCRWKGLVLRGRVQVHRCVTETRHGKLDVEHWERGRTGRTSLYVSADAKRIYTTNVSSGTVSILTDTLVQGGPPGPPPGQGRPTPQGPPPVAADSSVNNGTQTIVPVSRGSEGFDRFAGWQTTMDLQQARTEPYLSLIFRQKNCR